MLEEAPENKSMQKDVGLSNPDYHRHAAISKSKLDLINKSPAHYWARYLDPNRVRPEPTKAMILGSAFHTLVLEEDKFQDEYCVSPTFNRRTKDGKLGYEAFKKAHEGKIALTSEDSDTLFRMQESIFKHPSASKLLALKGKAEQTFMWDDEETGLQCKCRPDFHSEESKIVIDLKTTEDASPDGFSRSIHKYRYHVQAAWYLRGCPNAAAFLFIAVEKTPPYAVVCYQADPEMVAAGERAMDINLALISACKKSDKWPSYANDIQPLSLPRWNND